MILATKEIPHKKNGDLLGEILPVSPENDYIIVEIREEFSPYLHVQEYEIGTYLE